MGTSIEELRWPLKEHTKAKHVILRSYMDAWMPILSKWKEKILYVDGFSGPGQYLGGEDGSPVIVLDAYLKQPKLDGRLTFIFMEADESRFKHLRKLVSDRFPSIGDKARFRNSTFEQGAKRMLDYVENTRNVEMVASFWFVDPFGYSQVSMETVSRISRRKQSEMLFHLMTSYVKRFAHEQPDNMKILFGEDVRGQISPHSTPDQIKDYYISCLKRQTNWKYFIQFELVTAEGNRHHLVFATGHKKGLEVMKSAMWKADKQGNFRFSVKDAALGDLLLIPDNVYQLEYLLAAHFKGQTVTIEEVDDFVLCKTLFSHKSHLRLKTLKPMENDGKITVIAAQKRNKGQYPEGCQIRFK